MTGRELQNVIERAVIISNGPVLKVTTDDLRARVPSAEAVNGNNASGDAGTMRGMLDDAERKQILAALKQTRWVVAGPYGAAALLGMKRSALHAHMQRLGDSHGLGRVKITPNNSQERVPFGFHAQCCATVDRCGLIIAKRCGNSRLHPPTASKRRLALTSTYGIEVRREVGVPWRYFRDFRGLRARFFSSEVQAVRQARVQREVPACSVRVPAMALETSTMLGEFAPCPR
jgi:hypothetical protein